MANFLNSINMNMPIPVAGVDNGPDWALNINSSLTILDGHDHSSGKGVQISPTGLNINSDLTFLSNNAIALRSVRFTPQSGAISLPTDLGCLYEVTNDLYYNDGLGNQIRITQGGSVTGSSGTITGLPSGTASASYSAGTFVFQSATNTPANVDGGSFVFRNNAANSKGLTLNPPSAMGSDYSLTLPNTPAANNTFVTIDTGGNMGAAVTVDNTTITISGNQLSVVGSSIVPPGAIIPFAGTSAPTGYLLCDGSAVSRTTYSGLFSAIGVAYGYGNNSTTFNVPDLRGLFLRGVDGTAGRDPNASSRTALNTGGNTGNNVGSYQGQATAKNGLALSDPGHTHSATFSTQPPSGGGAASLIAGPNFGLYTGSGPINSSTTGVSLGAGDSETRPVNVYVNYLIKT